MGLIDGIKKANALLNDNTRQLALLLSEKKELNEKAEKINNRLAEINKELKKYGV